MSRAKLFVVGVLSSYVAVATNVLYTISSIPIALHYLAKEEFGLWSLAGQMTGYLMLLDLGMSAAVGRFLADYKDDMNGGEYGSVLLTGQTVFAIQGLIIAVVGSTLAFLTPTLLAVPADLRQTFIIIMSLQCLIAGVNLGTRMMGSPLWSHQRYDISNMATSVSLIGSLAAMWTGFHLGWKIYSLLFATAVGFVFNLVIPWVACHRLGLYPKAGHWGSFDRKLFKEMFGFGGGLFLMSLGSQLTSASQLIMLTRMMGLDGAATWAVMTKPYGLGQQFIGRIFDSSAGGLTEMHVRGERPLLIKRFSDLVVLTAAIAAFAAVGLAVFNGTFVEIWASGKIHWPAINNPLLGLLLLCTMITRCHTGLAGISKEIGAMKYVYLLEGVCFVMLSTLLVPRWGFSGLLVSSITCNVAITGVYGTARSARYFTLAFMEVARLILRALLFFATAIALAIPLQSVLPFHANWLTVAIFALILTLACSPLFWWIGLPPKLRIEIANMAARGLKGLRRQSS